MDSSHLVRYMLTTRLLLLGLRDPPGAVKRVTNEYAAMLVRIKICLPARLPVVSLSTFVQRTNRVLHISNTVQTVSGSVNLY